MSQPETTSHRQQLDQALQMVADRGDSAWAHRLIRKGANVSEELDSGRTLLHQAAREGDEQVARLLIRHGADINATDDRGNTPLHLAARHNQIGVGRVLTRDGALLNALNRQLQTPLDEAARPSNAIGNFLTEQGGEPSPSFRKFVQQGDVQSFREGLARVTFVTPDDQQWLINTLLPEAVRQEQAEIVRLLLNEGQDLDNLPDLLTDPLQTAVRKGNVRLAQLLVKHGAPLNAPSYKIYPLHIVAQKGHSKIARMLLQKGAQVNVMDSTFQTPLDRTRPPKIKEHLRQAGGVTQQQLVELIEKGDQSSFRQVLQSCALYPDMQNHLPARLFELTAEMGQFELLRMVYRKAGRKIKGTPLHKAVQHGHPETVDALLQLGVSVNDRNERGEVPLHIAVKQGQSKMVERLLQQGADPHIPTEEGLTALDYAIQARHLSLCRQLIEAGAKVDKKTGPHQTTPLHQAAAGGVQKIVQYLIKKGASLSVTDTIGATPLHYAASAGNFRICEQLVKAGDSVNVTDSRQMTPLHWAVRDSQRAVIQWLCQNGANLNAIDDQYQTPLHWAVRQQLPPVCATLLQNGAQPNIRDHRCQTPLDLAQPDTLKDIIQLLREYKGMSSDSLRRAMRNENLSLIRTFLQTSMPEVTPHCPVETGDIRWGPSRIGKGTLFHSAVVQGSPAVANLLMEEGWDINARAADGMTPLFLAVLNEQDSMARWLLRQGAKTELIGGQPHRLAPLHLAARQGDLSLVRDLLQQGATINVMSSEFHTARDKAIVYDQDSVEQYLRKKGGLTHQELRDAFQNNSYDTIRHFLQTCSNPTLRQEHGYPTWMHFAIYYGDTTTCRFMIEHGFSVDTSYGSKAYSPLMAAIRTKDRSKVKLFLRHGADPDRYGGFRGRRPLHMAVAKNLPEITNLLIEHGADVDARTGGEESSGKTPLHLAIEKGHQSMIRLLLEQGADLAVPDRSGNTPLHTLVEESRDRDLCRLLLKHHPPLEVQNEKGAPPFLWAVRQGRPELADLIWGAMETG